MPAKKPAFLGTYTRSRPLKGGGTEEVAIDMISLVKAETFDALGLTPATSDQLAGKIRTGKQGQYRYPKPGKITGGLTVIIQTDQITEKGNIKTFQFPIAKDFPLHVLDQELSTLTPVGFTIVSFSTTRGRRTALGSTIVTP